MFLCKNFLHHYLRYPKKKFFKRKNIPNSTIENIFLKLLESFLHANNMITFSNS